MQNSIIGTSVLRITQGENTTGSHKGSLAMDSGGASTSGAGAIDTFNAPWDGKVVRADGSSNNAMFIESLAPVKAPDGTIDIQRLVLIHTNAYELKAGETFKQGQHIYSEGRKGVGPNDIHIHMEGGYGTWDSVGGARLSQNAQGAWYIAKQEHLYNMMFLPLNCVVKNTGGYNWTYVNDTGSTAPESSEDDMKLKIFAAMDKVPSSQLMKEGAGRITYMNGKLYDIKGDARMVKNFDNNISEVFADMLSEIQPGEIMMATED